ncbi:transposase [Paenibacillus sp. LjRoot56]|uniref:transposase n=1 Tax=Paenibacillus sp. LjRoot56 TaxID=3342333 RepID=UPI003ECF167F
MAGGRPSKYFSHVEPKLLLIEAWARNGLTEEQMCENLGVSIAAFSNYKLEYKELVDALKNGKEVIDTMVENALLKAALGYNYEETKETADGFEKSTKFAQPNTTALIFWLKNRKPKDWRDKQDIEHSGKMVMFSGESKLED